MKDGERGRKSDGETMREGDGRRGDRETGRVRARAVVLESIDLYFSGIEK